MPFVMKPTAYKFPTITKKNIENNRFDMKNVKNPVIMQLTLVTISTKPAQQIYLVVTQLQQLIWNLGSDSKSIRSNHRR